jgi:BirA family biotin operon repressor/biotin-[acetyl-CoA-carboxylase] ligase
VLDSIDQAVVDLETLCGAPADRNRVLGVLLDELAEILDCFAADGFKPLRPEWESHHAHQGRAVDVHFAGGNTERGVARGVADDGALLLETSAGLKRVHSGEVSVRGVPREAAAA